MIDIHSIVYYYNGAQRYEQFLQVGRLYWALIWLGLALCSECLCVFFGYTLFFTFWRAEHDGIGY